MTKLAAQLGLAFAIALTIIETVHNWDDWSDPAMWIIDYLACAMLYTGSYLVLHRNTSPGPRSSPPAGASAARCSGWRTSASATWCSQTLLPHPMTSSF